MVNTWERKSWLDHTPGVPIKKLDGLITSPNVMNLSTNRIPAYAILYPSMNGSVEYSTLVLLKILLFLNF